MRDVDNNRLELALPQPTRQASATPSKEKVRRSEEERRTFLFFASRSPTVREGSLLFQALANTWPLIEPSLTVGLLQWYCPN
jgi:hypothetical protein